METHIEQSKTNKKIPELKQSNSRVPRIKIRLERDGTLEFDGQLTKEIAEETVIHFVTESSARHQRLHSLFSDAYKISLAIGGIIIWFSLLLIVTLGVSELKHSQLQQNQPPKSNSH